MPTLEAERERLRERVILRPPEAARIAGVDPRVMRNWARAGRIPGAFRTLGGQLRIPLDGLLSVIQPIAPEEPAA
jgi:hypothetical protein